MFEVIIVAAVAGFVLGLLVSDLVGVWRDTSRPRARRPSAAGVIDLTPYLKRGRR